MTVPPHENPYKQDRPEKAPDEMPGRQRQPVLTARLVALIIFAFAIFIFLIMQYL